MRRPQNVDPPHYPRTACRIGIVVSFGVRHRDECSEHSFFCPAISSVQSGCVATRRACGPRHRSAAHTPPGNGRRGRRDGSVRRYAARGTGTSRSSCCPSSVGSRRGRRRAGIVSPTNARCRDRRARCNANVRSSPQQGMIVVRHADSKSVSDRSRLGLVPFFRFNVTENRGVFVRCNDCCGMLAMWRRSRTERASLELDRWRHHRGA